MHKASVLVVEDQLIIAADIENKLNTLGYQVVGPTDSGFSAVELASRKRPDLVLMDVRLNGSMDGLEAAVIIRRDLGLPVLFLSAHADAATLERAGQSETFEYLLRPFEERELRTHIEIALYKHAAEQRLVEADRSKSEFIGLLSHELRNPLEAIRGSLDLLDMEPPAGEPAQRCLAIIRRQTTQLARLVDDLLDVTRISQNKLQLHRQILELRALVAKAVEDEHLLQQRGLKVVLKLQEQPVYVRGDAARLRQVLGNLLHNSAKFTPPGGTVTTALSVQGKQAVLRVTDTGQGIEAELLEVLFQPFMQADRSLAHGAGGLGLGLSVAKGIVDLHEGQVSVTSRGPGLGAEFVVRLPLSDGPAVEPPAAESAPCSSRRMLVVDDNPDIAELLREVLEHEGHEVDVAYTATEALEKARISPPEIVLCDIGLPGMNGYEFASIVRATPALSAIFMVAISGYAQPSDVARALAAGFDEHLAKPINPTRFAEILAHASVPSKHPQN